MPYHTEERIGKKKWNMFSTFSIRKTGRGRSLSRDLPHNLEVGRGKKQSKMILFTLKKESLGGKRRTLSVIQGGVDYGERRKGK